MRLNPHRVKRPLYSRAEFCDAVLDEIERQPLKQKDRRRIEATHLRFLDWIKSLGVCVEDGPNLDSQLDPSRNKIRLLITLDLADLEEDLLTVLTTVKRHTVPKLPDGHFDSQLADMEAALTRLEDVASIILFYSPAGFGWRVALYRKRHENPDVNGAIIKHIRATYPALQPKFHHEPPGWWKSMGVGYFESGLERPTAPGDEPAGLLKALADAILFTHYKTLYHRHESEQERIGPKDPDPALWRLPVAETLQTPTDPPPTNCPVCGEVCSEDSLAWDQDMCHFLHTAKPYVCLDEKCNQSSPPSFETERQWQSHMRIYHGSDWVRKLQRNLHWKCPMCPGVSPAEFESTELMAADLVSHLHSHHAQEKNKRILNLARISRMPCDRPSDTCPICGKDYSAGSEPPRRSLDKGTQAATSTKQNGDKANCNPSKHSGSALPEAEVGARRNVYACVAEHMLELSLKFTYPALQFSAAASQFLAESPSSSSPTSLASDSSDMYTDTNPSLSTHSELPHKATFAPSLPAIRGEDLPPPIYRVRSPDHHPNSVRF
ncbi:hypothetical protein A9K55_009127 [Cordyceps militaris]|uniref:Uncharacterized protein n=1 Tax=Cordyceps militaris TaxID=73501 RepID=A0A2H4SJK8_CORMI|nr:hypothetical protein A9K55_009127 [Cordyceps militaris]